MHKSGFVNIIGNPNVGKSTLMNALVGEKLSIITSKAQTTRHRILGIVNGDDFQIVFSDTPGILKPCYKLQESMMNFVRGALSDADVLLYVTDTVERDDERAAEIIDRIRQSGVPTLVVVNKIDLTTQEALEALVEKWRATLPDAEIIPISAREGFNIAGLFDRILALLPEGEPFYPKDTLTDKTLRFFASEIIREKILRNYDKEIPYSCEIEIEEYREEPGIDRISAVIYVARNSQKGILIGHEGGGSATIPNNGNKPAAKSVTQTMKRFTMRKGITGVLLALALTIGAGSRAQYDRDYFYYVGRSFMIDNNFEDAIRTLNILLRFDDDAYEGYFLRGIAKYNLDDLLGAEADFTTAIEKNPVFTTAFTYRAITRSRLGNYDDALSDFAEAIELRPDLPNAYYSRGVTRLLNQQFREAIDDFDKFIRQENKVSDAYLNRGVCYLYLKDTTQAYADFETAIRTNRENPMSYNRRGELEMKQQRYKEAEADFDMAIRCDSNYLLSYFNRAIVYSSTNRPMQSLADFDRVLQLDSTNSLTYFNRAIVRSQIGDYNRALEDYDKVAFYSPENVLVYYNRAGIQAQLGNIESAVEDYSKAIELYPDFANAYLNRSRLRYLLKDESGSRRDRDIAQRKIAEYKTRLSDSTYSIYAAPLRPPAGVRCQRRRQHLRTHRLQERRQPPCAAAALPLHAPHARQPLHRHGGTLPLAARGRFPPPHRQPVPDAHRPREQRARRLARHAGQALRPRADGRTRIVGAAVPARHHPDAHQAVHQCRRDVHVGHRPVSGQPVPLSEPVDHAGGDDRLHLVDRQLLPAYHHRVRSGQAVAELAVAHLQLRRGDRRPEQGREALPRLPLHLLQSREPHGAVGKTARSLQRLHESDRAEPRLRRSVLQPRAGADLHEGHAQGLSRHVESRRTGYSGGLRNPETIHRTRPMIRSTHSITAPTAPATAVGRVHTLHNGDAAETVLRKLSPKFNNQ